MGQAFDGRAWSRLAKGLSKVTPPNTVIGAGERTSLRGSISKTYEIVYNRRKLQRKPRPPPLHLPLVPIRGRPLLVFVSDGFT